MPRLQRRRGRRSEANRRLPKRKNLRFPVESQFSLGGKKSLTVASLWFQESHRQVGPAAHGDSVDGGHAGVRRAAAGAQQLGGLDREFAPPLPTALPLLFHSCSSTSSSFSPLLFPFFSVFSSTPSPLLPPLPCLFLSSSSPFPFLFPLLFLFSSCPTISFPLLLLLPFLPSSLPLPPLHLPLLSPSSSSCFSSLPLLLLFPSHPNV